MTLSEQRERFEKWARTNRLFQCGTNDPFRREELLLSEERFYFWGLTQAAWEAWQASQPQWVSVENRFPEFSDASKSLATEALGGSDAGKTENSATPQPERLERFGDSYLRYLMKHGLVMIEVAHPIKFHGLEPPYECPCHPNTPGVSGPKHETTKSLHKRVNGEIAFDPECGICLAGVSGGQR